jgi:hypothetical protein
MTANTRNRMASMDLGAAPVAPRQYPRAKAARAIPRTTFYRCLRVGIEILVLLGLFLVLAGAALYLRARLGFVL